MSSSSSGQNSIDLRSTISRTAADRRQSPTVSFRHTNTLGAGRRTQSGDSYLPADSRRRRFLTFAVTSRSHDAGGGNTRTSEVGPGGEGGGGFGESVQERVKVENARFYESTRRTSINEPVRGHRVNFGDGLISGRFRNVTCYKSQPTSLVCDRTRPERRHSDHRERPLGGWGGCRYRHRTHRW